MRGNMDTLKRTLLIDTYKWFLHLQPQDSEVEVLLREKFVNEFTKAFQDLEEENANLSLKQRVEDLEYAIAARGGFAEIDDNKAKAVLYDALEKENANLRADLDGYRHGTL